MGVVINWSTGYNGSVASIDTRAADMPVLADGVHDVLASHVNTLADAVIALQTRQAPLITTVAAHDALLAVLTAASLTVRDVDGTPSVASTTVLEFPNGSVTDIGGGVARVTFSTDHGGLTGLADDDHVQYLLIDGTRDMTGHFTPNADGTLDIGFDSEVSPRWWRAAYIETVNAVATETSTLDVAASATINEAFFSAGSLANPSLNFWDSGFYAPSSGLLHFESGGADVLALSGGGGSVTGNWNPSADVTYNLGTGALRWNEINVDTINAGSITTTTPIAHSSLSGLTAGDPHTQYLLVDGTRAMSGALSTPGVGVSTDGTASATAIYRTTDTDTGIWFTTNTVRVEAGGSLAGFGRVQVAAAGTSVIVGGATRLTVTSTQVTSAVQYAGPAGSIGAPTYSFTDPTSGFYRYAADAIGIALAGSAKFAFSGNYLYTNQSLGGLSSTASNNAIGIRTVIGNSATGIGLLIDNSTTFTAASGGQSHVELRSTVNQAASTAGYSSLKINVTNTALGSGAQYLADFQIASTTVAAITNGTTAATQGRVLAGYGATATPGLGFLGDDTVGLVRTSTGTMGVISQSAERWRFEGGTFYAMANGAAIRQNVANGSLIVYGNITSATDDRAGIQIINVNNMSGASGSARHVLIENNINQSGTAGYTVLDVVADEVGTGSGSKYLINAKAGAGGTTQRFAVMNDGAVRLSNGTLTSAALGFLSNPDTGIITADALGSPGVPAMLFMVDGVFAGGFIDEASTGDVQFRTVSGSLAVPGLAIDQNDLGFYAPSGNVGAAVVDGVEVFRWEAPAAAATFTVASTVKHTSVGIFPTAVDKWLGDSVTSPFAAALPWGGVLAYQHVGPDAGTASLPTFGWDVTGFLTTGIFLNGAVAISDEGTEVANFNGKQTTAISVVDGIKLTPSISTSGTGGFNAVVIDVAEPVATGSGAKSLLDLRYATTSKLKVRTSGQIIGVDGSEAVPTYADSTGTSGIYFDGNRVHFVSDGTCLANVDKANVCFAPNSDNAYTLGASFARWSDVYAVTTTIGDLVMKDPNGGRAHLKLVEGEGTLHVYDVRNNKKYHVPLVEDEMTDADRAFIAAERARWPEYND